MRFFKKMLFFLLLSGWLFSKGNSAFAQGYVAKYKEVTDSLAVEFGIPYEVIMAVAIVESGAGTSKVAQKLQNHFGIVGPNKVRWSRFKQYDTDEDSFRDFCVKMTTKKFYERLKGNPDHKKWIFEISKTGYASHPKRWRAMLYKAIAKHKLMQKTSVKETPP